MTKKKEKMSKSEKNSNIAFISSIIICIFAYIYLVNPILNEFNIGIGWKIGFIIFEFFVCLGLISLILNTGDAMKKGVDN